MIMRQLLMLVGCLISYTTYAQYSIQGTVQNEQQEALMFANVILLTENEEFIKGAVADTDGFFVFNDVATGQYILKVSALGFLDYQQTIELKEELNLGPLIIRENAVALDEVTVTAQKVAYVRKADRTVVNVGSLPTAAGGNALELLEKSPAVRLDRVSGNVALLGRENVLLFINGKRSRLEGNDLLQYLATIPAANIESLELINNPPASYDADGTGGVINIVLKNYTKDGFNGNAGIYAGYGQRGKYGGTLAFNYKSGRLNIYGDGATSQDYTNQDSDISTQIQFNDGLLATDQESLRPAYLANYSGKLGLTYELTPTTTIDVFGSYARRRWELSAETTTQYRGDITTIQSDFFTGSETNSTNQYNFSINLQQRLKNGHTLSADYDYLNFDIINPTSYRLQNFDQTQTEVSTEVFQSAKETPFDFHVARLDYQGDFFEKVNFQTGLKMTLTNVQNNTALIDGDGQVDPENLFTDNIDLSEEIYAAYFSVDGNFGDKWGYTAGLRYEYSDLDLTAQREGVNRQVSRLFPSLSLTRNFSETSRLTLAYRERISRPGFQNLAPAFFFLNPYTVFTGNVQALPNINKTIEATLQHGALFISLSYAADNNPIVRGVIPQLNQEDNLLLLISDNIDDRKQLGLTLGFPINLNQVWSSRYSLGSYYRRDVITIEGATFTEGNPFFTVDMAQTFQLPKKWSVEISGKWNSSLQQGTIYQPQQTTINLGLQKKFNRSTLGLSWSDIFNSGSFLGFDNDLPEQGINYDWTYDFEGSVVRLSYTHSFGGGLTKKSRRSGATEVLKRVQE